MKEETRAFFDGIGLGVCFGALLAVAVFAWKAEPKTIKERNDKRQAQILEIESKMEAE